MRSRKGFRQISRRGYHARGDVDPIRLVKGFDVIFPFLELRKLLVKSKILRL
jgi:hypothetical protein